MKTIGLLGGTSWVSTMHYYRIINELVYERMGKTNSAKILLNSINFEELQELNRKNDQPGIVKLLVSNARIIQKARADCLLLCANTLHQYAGDVSRKLRIPLISIVEETVRKIEASDVKTIALLGTSYTMEGGFYQERLQQSGIKVLIPPQKDRDFVHNSIYRELTRNIVKEGTSTKYMQIIAHLLEEGAEGIILGCTEIPLLINNEECHVLLFDTTKIHAEAAVEFAMQ